MTKTEFDALLRRTTLPPRTEFVWEAAPELGDGALKVSVCSDRPDARVPAQSMMVNVALTKTVEGAVLKAWDERQALSFLMGLLIDLERHEVHEWFRVDGRHVVDPHPKSNAAEDDGNALVAAFFVVLYSSICGVLGYLVGNWIL